MRSVRNIFVVVALLIFGGLTVSAARHGLAHYAYGPKGSHASGADFEHAIRLADNDPDPELFLADALYDAKRNQEAVKHCERAVALRPGDYFSWMELGYLRQLAGDLTGACQAHAQAVALAPFYGEPHWRLGTCLLAAGRRDDGFAELRAAVKSRGSYLGQFVQLAWDTTAGDPKALADAIRPSDAAGTLTVARFLRGKDLWEDSLRFYQQAGAASDPDLHGLVSDLINGKRYLDAYRVWQTNHGAESNPCSGQRGCLSDPGFETTSKLEDTGFGWCVPKPIDGVDPAIDESVASSGQKSLRIQFDGDVNPAAQVVSQLVLVRPSTRYRLSFKAKTANVKSVALPVLAVVDPASEGKTTNAAALPSGTNDWQSFAIEFSTSVRAEAVMLMLNRTACQWADCPIFGTVWLDDFTLQQV